MKKQNAQKTYTYTTGLNVLRQYCAYQERSHNEVWQKALKLRFSTIETERAICQLIEEDFLNEGRFVQMYTKGKFHLKKWGPQKIQYMLKQKGVSDVLIKEFLSQISKEEQYKNLQYLIDKKRATIKAKNPFIIKKKLIQYLLSKGFLLEDIVDLIK
ncbi:MAG: regulatory protein RecX [Chitinophagaceae bacterium]